jgi:hypothetical protein
MRNSEDQHPSHFTFHPRRMPRLLKCAQPRRYSDKEVDGLSVDVKNDKIHYLIRWRDRDGTNVAMYLKRQFLHPTPDRRSPRFKLHTGVGEARQIGGALLTDWHEKGIDPRDAVKRKSRTAMKFRDDLQHYVEMKRRDLVWTSIGYGSPEVKLTRSMERHCQALLKLPTQEITAKDIAECLVAVRAKATARAPMIHMVLYLRWYIEDIISMAFEGEHSWRFPATYRNPATRRALKAFIKLPREERKKMQAMEVDPTNQSRGVAEFYKDLCLLRHRVTNKHGKNRSGMTNAERAVGDLALRFLLLTDCPRTIEVRRCKWKEIYLDGPNPEWIIPAERMLKRRGSKLARGDFHIPLSYLAVALLRFIRPENPDPEDFVFSWKGTFNDKALPNHMLGTPVIWNVMRHRLGVPGTEGTIHGFRSTIHDFAMIYHPHLVIPAEIGLDHIPFDKVNETYRRTHLPDDRRALADVWGEFLESALPPEMRTPRPAEAAERRRRYEQRRFRDATPQVQFPEMQLLIDEVSAMRAQLMQLAPGTLPALPAPIAPPAAAPPAPPAHVSTFHPPAPELTGEVVEFWKPGWEKEYGIERNKGGRNYVRRYNDDGSPISGR